MYKYLLIAFPLVLVGCQALEPLEYNSGRSTTNTYAQREVADLTEEVKQMQYQIGQLTLELEEQRRQNAQFREQLRLEQMGLKQILETQVANLRQADQQQQKEIMAQMNLKLERLAARIQKTIDSLAKAIDSQPSIPVTQFSNNYPKKGVAYTVQSGDTLSEIARKFNATVSDIQNANKIADPKALRTGQTIFIPQNATP